MNAGSYLTGYNNPYPSYGYNQTPTGTTPCGCDTSGTPMGGVEAKPTSVSSQNTPVCTSVPETSPTATSTLTYPTATYSYFVKAPAVPSQTTPGVTEGVQTTPTGTGCVQTTPTGTIWISQTTPTGTVGVQTTPTGTENFTITSATPTPGVIIFSASRLEKYHFTSEMISKYFDEVKNSNGVVTGYRVKSGYSIVELKKQAKEAYEKQIEEDNCKAYVYFPWDLYDMQYDIENGVYDKEVTSEEAKSKVNELTKLWKECMQMGSKMSSSFADAVEEFALSELDLQDGLNYNLKEVLTQANQIFEALTGKMMSDENTLTNHYGVNITEDDLLNPGKCEDLFELKTFFVEGTSLNIWRDSDDWNEETEMWNLQNKFLSKLFGSVQKELGFNWTNDPENHKFYQFLIDKIAEKLGVSPDTITPKDIMEKLSSNGNGSWLDEMYDIVNNYTNDRDIINSILNENDLITGEQLAYQLDKLNLDKQPDGAKNFFKMIKQVMQDKFNLHKLDMVKTYMYNYKYFCNSLIKLINDKFGIENSNPPVLRKETLEKIAGSNILDTIKNIINSKEFEDEYYFGSIDGEINDFGQGKSALCPTISNIISASHSDKCRQKMIEAVTEELQENGEIAYRVTIKDMSVLVTREDIINAKKSDYHTKGDTDELIWEIAIHNKFGLEMGIPNLTYIATYLFDDYIYMNSSYNCGTYNLLNEAYDALKNDNAVLTCGMLGHEYSIIDINIDESNPANNTVTLINPYESDKPFTYTWDVLKVKCEDDISCCQKIDTFDVQLLFKNFDKFDDDISPFDKAKQLKNAISAFTSDLEYISLDQSKVYIPAKDKLPELIDKIIDEVNKRHEQGLLEELHFDKVTTWYEQIIMMLEEKKAYFTE